MTTSDVIFGHYVDVQQCTPVISRLTLDILPLDMIVQWRRCGQTADYVAAFLAYHFRDFGRAMNVLSTVLNEMVENGVRFSDDKRHPMRLVALFSGDHLVLESTNSIGVEQDAAFREFVERLFNSDFEDLFVSQVEQSAEFDLDLAGLGLISLKNDYVSAMGMCFRAPDDSRPREVAVQLHLDPEMY